MVLEYSHPDFWSWSVSNGNALSVITLTLLREYSETINHLRRAMYIYRASEFRAVRFCRVKKNANEEREEHFFKCFLNKYSYMMCSHRRRGYMYDGFSTITLCKRYLLMLSRILTNIALHCMKSFVSVSHKFMASSRNKNVAWPQISIHLMTKI